MGSKRRATAPRVAPKLPDQKRPRRPVAGSALPSPHPVPPHDTAPVDPRLPINVQFGIELRRALDSGNASVARGLALQSLEWALTALPRVNSERARRCAQIVQIVLYGSDDAVEELSSSARRIAKRPSHGIVSMSFRSETGEGLRLTMKDTRALSMSDSLIVEQLYETVDASRSAALHELKLGNVDLFFALAAMVGVRPDEARQKEFVRRLARVNPNIFEDIVRAFLRAVGWSPNKVKSAFSRLDKREQRSKVRRRTF